MAKRTNGNQNKEQLTLEKELELEGAFDRDLEMGRKKYPFNNPIVIKGEVRPLTRQESEAVLVGVLKEKKGL